MGHRHKKVGSPCSIALSFWPICDFLTSFWDDLQCCMKQFIRHNYILFKLHSKYPKSGVLNLWGLAYPQINAVPLLVPLNKNLTQIVPLIKKILNFRDIKDQNRLFLSIWKLLTSYKLLAYPLWTCGVPPKVRVPQVENRCPKSFLIKSEIFS